MVSKLSDLRQKSPGAAFFIDLADGTGSGKTVMIPAALASVSSTPRSLRYHLGLGLRSLTFQTATQYSKKEGPLRLSPGIDFTYLVGNRTLTSIFEAGAEKGRGSLEAFSKSEAGKRAVDKDARPGNLGSDNEPSSIGDFMPNVAVDSGRHRFGLSGTSANGAGAPILGEDWRQPDESIDVEARDSANDKRLPVLSSPILVATTDHFVEAPCMTRGKDVMLTLRAMSSDLALDEIDGYGESDLIPLGSSIFLAGFWGRNVLISSATTPHVIREGLYRAYRSGLEAGIDFFGEVADSSPRHPLAVSVSKNGIETTFGNVTSGWSLDNSDLTSFRHMLQRFQANETAALERLAREQKVNLAEVLPLCMASDIDSPLGSEAVAETEAAHLDRLVRVRDENFRRILAGAGVLHRRRAMPYQTKSGQKARVSFGFVKWNTAAAASSFAEWAARQSGPERMAFSVICYTAQQTVIDRYVRETLLEEGLDRTRSVSGIPPLCDARPDEGASGLSYVDLAIEQQAGSESNDKSNEIDYFVLVSTTDLIATGRNFCFDWAILDACQRQIVVQGSGRVLRHRRESIVDAANIMVTSIPSQLYANFRVSKTAFLPWNMPGVETDNYIVMSQYPSKRDLPKGDQKCGERIRRSVRAVSLYSCWLDDFHEAKEPVFQTELEASRQPSVARKGRLGIDVKGLSVSTIGGVLGEDRISGIFPVDARLIFEKASPSQSPVYYLSQSVVCHSLMCYPGQFGTPDSDFPRSRDMPSLAEYYEDPMTRMSRSYFYKTQFRGDGDNGYDIYGDIAPETGHFEGFSYEDGSKSLSSALPKVIVPEAREREKNLLHYIPQRAIERVLSGIPGGSRATAVHEQEMRRLRVMTYLLDGESERKTFVYSEVYGILTRITGVALAENEGTWSRMAAKVPKGEVAKKPDKKQVGCDARAPKEPKALSDKLRPGLGIFSHREHVVRYVEHCRVISSKDGLCFLRKEDAIERVFSIPSLNTACLLLGPGSSLTNSAARRLSTDAVLVAFVGGGGMPVFFASQSEYRKTEYLQGWSAAWHDSVRRFEIAKRFCRARAHMIILSWSSLYPGKHLAEEHVAKFLAGVESASSITQLMGYEGILVKSLYRELAKHHGIDGFRRENTKGVVPRQAVNGLISNGNYLAYGLAATALWILGIPHGFPVTHGATRRGALVFDVADIVKDACVLPLAFQCAEGGVSQALCRRAIIDRLWAMNCLAYIIDEIKASAGLVNE